MLAAPVAEPAEELPEVPVEVLPSLAEFELFELELLEPDVDESLVLPLVPDSLLELELLLELLVPFDDVPFDDAELLVLEELSFCVELEFWLLELFCCELLDSLLDVLELLLVADWFCCVAALEPWTSSCGASLSSAN